MKPGRGFTLVEMVVALAIFSMISVAIVGAMRILGNTSTALQTVTTRVEEIRAVSEFLRGSVGAAMPVVRIGDFADGTAPQTRYGTWFRGDARQLQWVAPMLAGADTGGAFVMYLAQVEDRLELRWHPYRKQPGSVPPGAVSSRVILEGVEDFEVGYLPSYQSEWLSQWPGDMSTPVAVRLTVRAADRYWPELVIRLDSAALNLR